MSINSAAPVHGGRLLWTPSSWHCNHMISTQTSYINADRILQRCSWLANDLAYMQITTLVIQTTTLTVPENIGPFWIPVQWTLPSRPRTELLLHHLEQLASNDQKIQILFFFFLCGKQLWEMKMFPNIGIKLSLQSKLKRVCKLRHFLFSDLTLVMWSMLKFYLFHIVSPVVRITSTLSALESSFWQSTAAAEQFEGFSSPSRGVKSGLRGILRRNTESFSPLFHVNHFSQADFFSVEGDVTVRNISNMVLFPLARVMSHIHERSRVWQAILTFVD